MRIPADPPTLATERLLLRPFTPADAPVVQSLAGAWEIADTTLNVPHPYPDGAAERWIANHGPDFMSGTGAVYAITERASGQLVGATGLGIDPGDARAELGYWVGVPFWGRGFATEAARALLAFGFGALELNRVQARHFTRNPASGRVMQKLGMVHEGTHRQATRKWDRFEDLAVYAILAEEWRT